MATGKSSAHSSNERQQAKREGRTQSVKAQDRSRLVKRLMKWGLVFAMVGAAVYGVNWLNDRGKEMGQAYPNQGQEHIADGAAHLSYNSNPPTSGPHYLQPAPWGIYQAELPDEALMHNLEHGGIWISYSHIDQATKDKIEALAKQHPNKMIVTPRALDDARIVLASWRRLLKLDRFDENAMVSFIEHNKNRAPEPNAM